MAQKTYPIDEFFLSPSKFFLSKNIFKVALQYLFNGFILFNTVFNLKLLKIDQICIFLKTWKKLRKPGENFQKSFCHPDFSTQLVFMFCFLFIQKSTSKMFIRSKTKTDVLNLNENQLVMYNTRLQLTIKWIFQNFV